MHQQSSTTVARPVRLLTPTVPRHVHESACAARDIAKRQYDQQTVALHRRSVAYLAAMDDNHRLRQLLVAHGINPEAA
ncbi:hypothetical protein WKR98_23225 [Pigmentiphaga sp. YJ18]|uniref:hypothetical protein n=1 Tax=unclassified Pigmentiphaga TaxID=2626614 RepID=UPI00244940EF|nr:hypothetical protein [Pigmentiphaga sp. GD03639]MDH2240198.1 hypothetical protein [Pigmentiphaga sp. GD03639]